MSLAVAILPAFLSGASAQSPALRTARLLEDAMAEVAARAVPAVVVVHVDRSRPFSPELQELLQEIGSNQPWRSGIEGDARGSGVIVSPDGRVITNHHVVSGSVVATLVLSDQRRLPARVIATDPRTDIAVLQIEAAGPWPFVSFGDSDDVRVGDLVVAVGSPFQFESTVTMGVISATGRRGLAEREIQDYLQTDAAVNPGSSGGPLLDLDGDVIGINTAIFAPAIEQNTGISFAIPSNMAARVVEELERRGRVPRAWVGLVTRTVEEVDGDPTLRGAEVLRVIPDGPAERAGLRRGDIVVEVDGEPIPSAEALKTYVLAHDVGVSLAFTAARDGRRVVQAVTTGEEREVGASLETLPEDAVHWAGMYLAEPTDELRAHFGVGMDRGVLVVRVEPESPAARLGVKTGDLLQEIWTSSLPDLAALRTALDAEQRGMVCLTLSRGGSRAYAVLPRP